MDRPIVAVVLAGGTGTRLYPASRSHRPKQFQSFGGDHSLLARTVDRVDFVDETYVLTREAFADQVEDHAPEATVLVEPDPKDTGPALVYAAARIREAYGGDADDDPVLLCLPSDHHVRGDFESVARRAASCAVETGGLVTIGIEPDRPATGYGYISPASGDSGADEGWTRVAGFREKPDEATARDLIADGSLWNAGMFAWTTDALIREARDTPLSPLADAAAAGDLGEAFDAVDAVSIDYAVLERTDDAYVVPAEFEWDDMGAWDALGRVLDGERGGGSDGDGNAILGDALTIDADRNVVASDDKHVSVVGVSDLVVVAYDDRVLVVPKDDAQRVREVVARLREDGLF